MKVGEVGVGVEVRVRGGDAGVLVMVGMGVGMHWRFMVMREYGTVVYKDVGEVEKEKLREGGREGEVGWRGCEQACHDVIFCCWKS